MFSTKEYNICFEKYNLTPLDIYNDYPKYIVSKQKEESINIRTMDYPKLIVSNQKEESVSIYTMDYPKFIVSNQKEESMSIQRVNNEYACAYAINSQNRVCCPIIRLVK